MIKIVWFILLSIPLAQALVPVEGIIMGEAESQYQLDPLQSIFSDIYDKSKSGENKKTKLYQGTYETGQALAESCNYLTAPSYMNKWHEKQAQRSVAATLQYIGLDTTIKAIGAYARKLEVNEEHFKKLTANLVKNYCSKNVTVFSLRNIEKSLAYYYSNPDLNIIPSIESSPFASQNYKQNSEKNAARSREFDLVIKNFRSFCSWGGEVEDYRMLSPYLSNRFIMSFVFKNMMGLQDKIDPKEQKVTTVTSNATARVTCNDLICRKENNTEFTKKFPTSIGSTGLVTDLSKLYCHHFRYTDSPMETIPQVREWIKQQELEDPIFETSQFISLMTGVPDLFNGVDSYREVPLLVRSSIDEKWNHWSREILGSFSKDLMYEESLKVKVEPRNMAMESSGGFKINLSVTLGEMDRLLKDNDKMQLSFKLRLSKNYLRHIRIRWDQLEKEVDTEGKKVFRDEVARYVAIQLKEKEKLFTQKIWNEDFSRLIADELVQQTKNYTGSYFYSYKEEVLSVPVNFSYGLFALSYLRYRADVATGRLKLKL